MQPAAEGTAQGRQLLAGQPALSQGDESGVEAYYQLALARWCRLSLDLQVVRPSTREIDTTVLLGARLDLEL